MKKVYILLSVLIVCGLVSSARRVAVLSDIHVTPGNACDSALRVAVDEINAGAFDLVVVNGDLSNEGSDEQLRNVHDILGRLRHPL